MSRIRGDLKDRTLAYGQRVLESLPARNTPAGWIVSKQPGRSGTSIGANVWEADHAPTEADFANKVSIARKESSECEYWLILAARVGLLTEPDCDALLAEARELTRILGTVVLRTQQHLAANAQPPKRRNAQTSSG